METGSLLNGVYAQMDKKIQVLQEIAGVKVICKVFETEEKMPAHSNATNVMVVVLAGKMEIIVEGEKQLFVAGDYVHFPPKAIHELLCIESAKIVIIK